MPLLADVLAPSSKLEEVQSVLERTSYMRRKPHAPQKTEVLGTIHFYDGELEHNKLPSLRVFDRYEPEQEKALAHLLRLDVPYADPSDDRTAATLESWWKETHGAIKDQLSRLRGAYPWLELFDGKNEIQIVEAAHRDNLGHWDRDGKLIVDAELYKRPAKTLPAEKHELHARIMQAVSEATLLHEGLHESKFFQKAVRAAMRGQTDQMVAAAVETYSSYLEIRHLRQALDGLGADAWRDILADSGQSVDMGPLLRLEDAVATNDVFARIVRERHSPALEIVDLIPHAETLISDSWRKVSDALERAALEHAALQSARLAFESARHYLNNSMSAAVIAAEMAADEIDRKSGDTKYQDKMQEMTFVLMEKFQTLSGIKNPYAIEVDITGAPTIYALEAFTDALAVPKNAEARETALRLHVSRQVFKLYEEDIRLLETAISDSADPENVPKHVKETLLRFAQRLKNHEWNLAPTAMDANTGPLDSPILLSSSNGDLIQTPLLNIWMPPEKSKPRYWPVSAHFWRTPWVQAFVGLLLSALPVWSSTDETGRRLHAFLSDPRIWIVAAAVAVAGGAVLLLQWLHKKWRGLRTASGGVALPGTESVLLLPPAPLRWNYPFERFSGDQRALRLNLYYPHLDFVGEHVWRVRRDALSLASRLGRMFDARALETLGLSALTHDLWKIREDFKKEVLRGGEFSAKRRRDLEVDATLSMQILEREMNADAPDGLKIEASQEELLLIFYHRKPWELLLDARIPKNRRRVLFELGLILLAANKLDGYMDMNQPHKRGRPMPSASQVSAYITTMLTRLKQDAQAFLSKPENLDAISKLKLETVLPREMDQVFGILDEYLPRLAMERRADADDQADEIGNTESKLMHFATMRSLPENFWPFTESELAERSGMAASQAEFQEALRALTRGGNSPLVRIFGDKIVSRENIDALRSKGMLQVLVQNEKRTWIEERDMALFTGSRALARAHVRGPEQGQTEMVFMAKKELESHVGKDMAVRLLSIRDKPVYVQFKESPGVKEKEKLLQDLIRSGEIFAVIALSAKQGTLSRDYVSKEKWAQFNPQEPGREAERRVMAIKGAAGDIEYYYRDQEGALLEAGILALMYVSPNRWSAVSADAAKEALANGNAHYALMQGSKSSMEGQKVYVAEAGLEHMELRRGIRFYLLQQILSPYGTREVDSADRRLIQAAYDLALTVYGREKTKEGAFKIDEAINLAAFIARPADIKVPAVLVAAALLVHMPVQNMSGSGIAEEHWEKIKKWIKEFNVLKQAEYRPPARIGGRRKYYFHNYLLYLLQRAGSVEPLLLWMGQNFHALQLRRAEHSARALRIQTYLLYVLRNMAEGLGLQKFSDAISEDVFETVDAELHRKIVAQFPKAFGGEAQGLQYDELPVYARALEIELKRQFPQGDIASRVKTPRSILRKLVVRSRKDDFARSAKPELAVENLGPLKLKDLVAARIVVEDVKAERAVLQSGVMKGLRGEEEEDRHEFMVQVHGKPIVPGDKALEDLTQDLLGDLEAAEEILPVSITRSAMFKNLVGARTLTHKQYADFRDALKNVLRRVQRHLPLIQIQVYTKDGFTQELTGELAHTQFEGRKEGLEYYPTDIVYSPASVMQETEDRFHEWKTKDLLKNYAYILYRYRDAGEDVVYPHRVPKILGDPAGDTRPRVLDVITRRGSDVFGRIIGDFQAIKINGEIVRSLTQRVSHEDELTLTGNRLSEQNNDEAPLLHEMQKLQDARNNPGKLLELAQPGNLQSRLTLRLWANRSTESLVLGDYYKGLIHLASVLAKQGVLTIPGGTKGRRADIEALERVIEPMIKDKAMELGLLGASPLFEAVLAVKEGMLDEDVLVQEVLMRHGMAMLKEQDIDLTQNSVANALHSFVTSRDYSKVLPDAMRQLAVDVAKGEVGLQDVRVALAAFGRGKLLLEKVDIARGKSHLVRAILELGHSLGYPEDADMRMRLAVDVATGKLSIPSISRHMSKFGRKILKDEGIDLDRTITMEALTSLAQTHGYGSAPDKADRLAADVALGIVEMDGINSHLKSFGLALLESRGIFTASERTDRFGESGPEMQKLGDHAISLAKGESTPEDVQRALGDISPAVRKLLHPTRTAGEIDLQELSRFTIRDGKIAGGANDAFAQKVLAMDSDIRAKLRIKAEEPIRYVVRENIGVLGRFIPHANRDDLIIEFSRLALDERYPTFAPAVLAHEHRHRIMHLERKDLFDAFGIEEDMIEPLHEVFAVLAEIADVRMSGRHQAVIDDYALLGDDSGHPEPATLSEAAKQIEPLVFLMARASGSLRQKIIKPKSLFLEFDIAAVFAGDASERYPTFSPRGIALLKEKGPALLANPAFFSLVFGRLMGVKSDFWKAEHAAVFRDFVDPSLWTDKVRRMVGAFGSSIMEERSAEIQARRLQEEAA